MYPQNASAVIRRKQNAVMSSVVGEEFLQQFGLRLARLLSPSLPAPTIQAAILQVIAEVKAAGALPQQALRQPDSDASTVFAGRKLELVFAHDCR